MSGLLDGLLDSEILTAEGEPGSLSDKCDLYPDEQAAISRAVQRRREQYAATRYLARRLFARLGLPHAPVLNRQDRSPIWPAGIRGSITHTDGWCAVALGTSHSFLGVGIDAEQRNPMQQPIWERILTPFEVDAMRRQGCDPAEHGTLWFSAKESVYKCLFDTVQRFIGFSEVELSFDFSDRSFCAHANSEELAASHGELVRRLHGRFAESSSLWVTSATLRVNAD